MILEVFSNLRFHDSMILLFFPEYLKTCQEMKTQGISVWVHEEGLLLLEAVFEMAGQ